MEFLNNNKTIWETKLAFVFANYIMIYYHTLSIPVSFLTDRKVFLRIISCLVTQP